MAGKKAKADQPKNSFKPPTYEEDERAREIERLASALDEERVGDMGADLDTGTKAADEEEKKSADEGRQEEIAPEILQQQLEILEGFTEIPDDVLDEIERASTADELQELRKKCEEVAKPVKADDEDEHDRKFIVKIDGEEKEVTLKELKEKYQKETTADKRLQEASLLKQEYERLVEAARSVDETLVDEEGEESRDIVPSKDEKGRGKKRSVTELVYAIRDGTEEEAEEALAEILATRTADPAQEDGRLRAIVQEELARRQQERIVARFGAPVKDGGFADLKEDHRLYAAAIAEVDRLIAEGADGTDWETYRKAGETIRAWAKKMGMNPTGTVEDDPKLLDEKVSRALAEKRKRKQKLSNIDGVQAKSPTSLTEGGNIEDDIEKFRREQMLEIAKSRGQSYVS